MTLLSQGLIPEDHSLQAAIKAHIEKVLIKKRFNISNACKALGISRTTLYRRMSEFDIKREQK